MLPDHLCDDCREHFERVVAGWRRSASRRSSTRLVRGFDYYTPHQPSSSSATARGVQKSIGGGGRYDKLASSSRQATSGVGFGSRHRAPAARARGRGPGLR